MKLVFVRIHVGFEWNVVIMWEFVDTYSYGHLPVITGYKWDYTCYKWGYKYLLYSYGHPSVLSTKKTPFIECIIP